MKFRWFAAPLLALIGVVFATHQIAAQDYPARPVRVVVPFAAGAGTDLLGRFFSQELTTRLGQQFFVENKPGAAAQLGTDLVAKSPADGYTLLWTVSDGLSALPAVKDALPYRIPEDFAFIAGASQMPFAVSVNANLPVKSMAELVAYAKANPNKLNFGSAGVGSVPHLGMALLGVAAKIDMVHVPFAGLGPTTNALLAGTVDLALITPPLIKPHVDANKTRALAVTGTARHPALPDVPTAREAGLDVTTIVNYGLSAPAGTPEPILAKLRTVMKEIIEDKVVVERLQKLGYEADHLIGNAYRDWVLKDLAQWRSVAKAANIKIAN